MNNQLEDIEDHCGGQYHALLGFGDSYARKFRAQKHSRLAARLTVCILLPADQETGSQRLGLVAVAGPGLCKLQD